ncbi:hypothetical protein [Agrobacterium larrymoorei]|uniref:Uncharacterized protein n=1 Tax=Agrobacterium larrymoorei TaxID=160699 RepID=A0ABU0UFA6_9HYPH|nr:hypothetical protein [Agrobacterium larrymoorei]MDQ1183592.1 hypothetical protein [Agrobacterium larrymoorei]
MKISLSPIRLNDTLIVEKNGDRLRINGDLLNFGPLPEGGTIKLSDIPGGWICDDVRRINGDLHICLVLPHGSDPAECVAFPSPLENPPDGVIDLPFSPYSTTSEEVVEGGRKISTTCYEWRVDPVTTIEFVPDPPPSEEEPDTSSGEISPDVRAALDELAGQSGEQINVDA